MASWVESVDPSHTSNDAVVPFLAAAALIFPTMPADWYAQTSPVSQEGSITS
jgi:hypothetical protein